MSHLLEEANEANEQDTQAEGHRNPNGCPIMNRAVKVPALRYRVVKKQSHRKTHAPKTIAVVLCNPIASHKPRVPIEVSVKKRSLRKSTVC